jgi:ketosteroid isomerase-like protein
MKLKRPLFAAFALIYVSALFAAKVQNPATADAERYIKESERLWAEAGVAHDVPAIERILADDFVGVAPDGSLYRKADEIANTKTGADGFVSNHVVEVNVRFFGDAAVAQGSEAWQKRNGERGRYVWTDTWIRRNNKWQVVAAEDLPIPESGH